MSSRINHTKDPEAIYIGRLASSPIGPMWVAISIRGLVVVEWEMPRPDFLRRVEQYTQATPIIDDMERARDAVEQLAAYLECHRREFTIPVDFSGMTPFQKQVLQLTAQIPYGQTATYKTLADASGHPGAARAVGRVEATNPIPIIIPCHRVVGTDGSLHGYGGPGGVKLKSWLLQLEQANK